MEFAKRLLLRLLELESVRMLLSDVVEEMRHYAAESKDYDISAYERAKVIDNIDAAKSNIWNLLGQLCNYDPCFFDEEFIKRNADEPNLPEQES